MSGEGEGGGLWMWWWRLQLMLCMFYTFMAMVTAVTTSSGVLNGGNGGGSVNIRGSGGVDGTSLVSTSEIVGVPSAALQGGAVYIPGLNVGGSGSTHQRSTRVIHTKYGELQGVIVNMPNKNLLSVEVYLGVPYAAPPIGGLRFMPPVASRPWNGIRQADHFKPVCPQKFPDISNETEMLRRMPRARYEYLKLVQPALKNYSEDCLNLNIYVPILKGN
ncbi:hypothetical protein CHUAL_001423 [Chamberlinius hualienensis]